MIKRYSELIQIANFDDRFKYLQEGLHSKVGIETFGGHRYLNQALYQKSYEWKKLRRDIVIRDNACDLAHPDHPIIYDKIFIHHLNPITIEDVQNRAEKIFDPENLVCISFRTHNLLHYGSESPAPKVVTERKQNDTCPWR